MTRANARPIAMGGLGVDLLAVQAADVVGLEDLRMGEPCHGSDDA